MTTSSSITLSLRILVAVGALVSVLGGPSLAQWKVESANLMTSEPGQWGVVWFKFLNPDPLHATADNKIGWAEVYIAIADSEKFGINVVAVNKFSKDFNVYEDGCKGIISTTGSFFKNLAPASGFTDEVPRSADGWVVVAGKEMSPRVNWQFGGAIVDDGSKVQVVPVADLDNIINPWMLIQSKPILLRGTKNDMRGDDRQYSMFRTAIGTTEGGKIAVALIRAPDAGDGVSLFEAADMLLQVNSRMPEGERMSDMLAMDGGPGAHMFVKRTREHIAGFTPVYIPNIICVSEREIDAAK